MSIAVPIGPSSCPGQTAMGPEFGVSVTRSSRSERTEREVPSSTSNPTM